MPIKKLQFGREIKPSPIGFTVDTTVNSLHVMARRVFPILIDKDFNLQYTDSAGCTILLDSDEEATFAVRNGHSLTVTVHLEREPARWNPRRKSAHPMYSVGTGRHKAEDHKKTAKSPPPIQSKQIRISDTREKIWGRVDGFRRVSDHRVQKKRNKNRVPFTKQKKYNTDISHTASRQYRDQPVNAKDDAVGLSATSEVFQTDHNLKNPDAELQQRAIEYLQMSKVASPDVLATILEEMPPFAEKESSLLAKLKKHKPQFMLLFPVEEMENVEREKKNRPAAIMSQGGFPEIGDATGSLVDIDQPVQSDASALVDIFGAPASITTNTHVSPSPTPNEPAVANKSDYLKFVTKSNGVLYEDECIQVGCKLEARNNLARLGMFYGNKTATPFTDFHPTVICPGPLAVQLQAQAKPVDPVVAAGTQMQQLINFVCVQEFNRLPIIQLTFHYTDAAGQATSFDKCFYLPIFINKFVEPTDMSSLTFFNKWKALGMPAQECQKITANQDTAVTQVEAKLACLGSKLLVDVDPNPENLVCAGIIHTQTQQIDPLEPNRETMESADSTGYFVDPDFDYSSSRQPSPVAQPESPSPCYRGYSDRSGPIDSARLRRLEDLDIDIGSATVGVPWFDESPYDDGE